MANTTKVLDGPLKSGGSAYITNLSCTSVGLIYNISDPVGSPNLIFTIQEADPNDPSVPIAGGQINYSLNLTAAGTGSCLLTGIVSSCILLTWVLTGGTFGNASLTIAEKHLGNFSGGGSISNNQGLPNTLVNGWPVKVTDGFNILGTDANPLEIAGSISATNPSVDNTGFPAPAYATEIGIVDAFGDLQPVSSNNPLPISGFPATQPISAVSLPLPTGATTGTNQLIEIANLQTINSLVPSVYDYIALSYTGSNLTTIVYMLGGSTGTTVSTLTLSYTGSNLTSVAKS